MTTSETAYFLDPETNDRLGDDEKEDVHGQDLIGVDDDGIWWGTDRAAWVLSTHQTTCYVHGWQGNHPYVGHFCGTAAEAIDYAETHGVTVKFVESGVVIDPS